MTVTVTKLPRDEVIIRANECFNPRIGANALWYDTGWGYQGTGSSSWYSGDNTWSKNWTNTPPAGAVGAGLGYPHSQFVAGQQKTCSADIYVAGFEPKMAWYFDFYGAGNVLLNQSQSASTQTVLNQTRRVAGTSAVAPAGTVRTDCKLVIAPGNQPQVGQAFSMKKVLIEPGVTAGEYFDGTTYASGNGSQRTAWEGPADNSRSLLLDWDPANVAMPALSEGWDEATPARSTFLDLLDYSSAAVLQPAGPRQGTLRLLWGDVGADPAVARAAAQAAAYQLRRGATYTYADTDLGSLGTMTFAVNGDVRLYVSDSRRTWRVDVPFREL